MGVQFSTLLLPVDFSLNAEMAVSKALAFCNESVATIHLLHIPTLSSTFSVGSYHFYPGATLRHRNLDASYINQNFEMIKKTIRSFRPDIEVVYWISPVGPVEEVIEKKAKLIGADLIIIGKKKSHAFFPFLNTVVPSRIAAKTGIPVLVVKPGAEGQSIRTIVLAVGSRFPDRKVPIVNSLQRRFHSKLILVSVMEHDHSDRLPGALVTAFRFFKSSSVNDVSCEILSGRNKAKAILKYCRKVNADLVVLTPESETKIGWPNRYISDEIPPGSKTQVMVIEGI